jgi:FKBP-type peptidyl-prolyl cis-trans isomerase
MFKKTIIAIGLTLAIATAPALSADKHKQAAKPAATKAPSSIPVKLAALPIDLKTKQDSVAYALGMSIGTNLKNNFEQSEISIDYSVMLKAMEAVFSNRTTSMTEDKEKEILTAFQTEMQAKMMEKQKKTADENLAKADAFLKENKTKEGVNETKSGLQYKVMTAGTGDMPKAGDQVKVHYKGTLLDGKVFDSSIDRGEPVTFPVTGVIPGWVEALQLMTKGSKWQLFIPPALAYGERGNQGIEPNSLLIFEVELLDVIPGQPAQPAEPAGQQKK